MQTIEAQVVIRDIFRHDDKREVFTDQKRKARMGNEGVGNFGTLYGSLSWKGRKLRCHTDTVYRPGSLEPELALVISHRDVAPKVGQVKCSGPGCPLCPREPQVACSGPDCPGCPACTPAPLERDY